MKRKINKSLFLTVLIFLGVIINSCSSDDSTEDNQGTNISAPSALEATDIEFTKFTARWQSVFGASAYQLDVSDNSGFSSFLDGYQGKVITGFSEVVENLEDDTDYFYRVRAVSGSNVSSNSNVISLKTPFDVPDEITLKDAAKDNFLVGVAVSAARTGLPAYDEVYTREFNSITAENDMKMASILTGIDANGDLLYDWSKVDQLIAYSEANNMNVHGHTLIWHRSIPQALQNFSGTNEAFEAIIEKYITDVLTRYKGKINSWDVVNEAIDDDEDGNGTIWRENENLFLDKMGENYVEKCFQFARNADPDVKLFYNDYNMTFDEVKRGKVLTMVDNLKSKGLIDGVGYQMHIDHNFPSVEQIQMATDELVAKDLLIHFAELDVKVNADNSLTTNISEERSLAQKQRVKDVVTIFNGIPQKNKYAITVWGLKDNDSWIPFNDEFGGGPDWPLLFDASFGKKDAYDGFIEALR